MALTADLVALAHRSVEDPGPLPDVTYQSEEDYDTMVEEHRIHDRYLWRLQQLVTERIASDQHRTDAKIARSRPGSER